MKQVFISSIIKLFVCFQETNQYFIRSRVHSKLWVRRLIIHSRSSARQGGRFHSPGRGVHQRGRVFRATFPGSLVVQLHCRGRRRRRRRRPRETPVAVIVPSDDPLLIGQRLVRVVNVLDRSLESGVDIPKRSGRQIKEQEVIDIKTCSVHGL